MEDARPGPADPHALVAPWLDRPPEEIRVVLGPQDDFFSDDQIAAFLAGPWTVTTKGDRMACFLDGTPLTHARGYNIVSDGIAMGAIQVPGEGWPIVLMADRQSTGGYPKIATVIGPDLGRSRKPRAARGSASAPSIAPRRWRRAAARRRRSPGRWRWSP